MMLSSYAFYGALEQGLVFGLMAVGVYLTFRVLDFPDLTVDGSLPLGAAVTAVAVTKGVDPYLSLVLALGAGFVAGMITGILNTKLKILHLLASILTMIALYSINLRIMGRPNISLFGLATVFDPFSGLGLSGQAVRLVLGGIFAVATIIFLVWFLATELGQTLLATGDNPQMITSQGVNTHWVIILGVGLSNGLVALSGALLCQIQGFADVNMGVGTIVAGLASVIVGETIFGRGGVFRSVFAAIMGSVIYRLAIAVALSLKMGEFTLKASDLKLITSILVILALVAPQIKDKIRRKCSR